MQFLYPGFLYALLALMIPILIHLFYFRRFKKVYFSNVKFLKELKEETSNRNRLKNLLILLARMLAFAFLVFAFAQPYLPAKDGLKEGANSVSIFVDNSFSMQSLSEDVPLLEQAKKKAREILNAYSEEDRFQILTHDFFPRHQRSLSKEDALSAIDEINISAEVKSLEKVLLRQNQVHKAAALQKRKSYLLSDFQSSITNITTFPDTNTLYYFLPIQSVQENNISIDSAWFGTPVPLLNQSNQLIFKMTNHGSGDRENIRVAINQDGQTKPFGLLDLDAGRSKLDTVTVRLQKPGVQQIELQLTDYPVQFDDRYLLSFKVPEQIKVLEIYGSQQSRYLDALFSGLNYFDLTHQSERNINYVEFPGYNLIILNDLGSISTGLSTELQKYISGGGNVMLFPGKQIETNSFNQFFQAIGASRILDKEVIVREVKELNTREFVFDNVFTRIDRNVTLPVSNSNYVLDNISNRKGTSLMKYRDGKDYFRKYDYTAGSLFLCTASLDPSDNDLVQKAEVFVPLLYKAALYTGNGLKPAYTIGKDELISIGNKTTGEDLVYKIKGVEEFIPGQVNTGESTIIDVNNMIKKEGVYYLTFEDEIVESFAFNYDRQESNLSCLSVDDLKKRYEPDATVYGDELKADFSDIIEQKEFGKYFWKWCLIGALLFLLIESLLIRFWKRN